MMDERLQDMVSSLLVGLLLGLLIGLVAGRGSAIAADPVLIAEIHNADREPGRAVQMPLSKVLENAEQGMPVTVVGVVGK